MKTKVTLFFLLTLGCIVSLNAQVSSLVVFSEERNPFVIHLNNIVQQDVISPIIRLEGVPAGTYQISIVFQDAYLGQIDFQLPVMQEEEHIIQISRRRAGELPRGAGILVATDKFMVRSQFRLPVSGQVMAYFRPLEGILPDVNNGGSIPGSPTINEGGSVNIGGNVNMDGVMQDSQTSVTSSTTTVTTTTVVEPEPVVYVPGYQGAIGCPYPMDEMSFQAARSSIESKTFASSQMTVAKQVTENNCLTVSQVKSIIQIFTFENDKLDFAKFAFDYTYDFHNYYQVNDEFTYPSSIDKLDAFLDSRR